MNRNLEAILWAMHAEGLSPLAWKILVRGLATRVNSERGDFDVWPSHAQIASDCETSVASVKRHMAELTGGESPFVRIVPRYRRSGGKAANFYRLNVRIKITSAGREISIDADQAAADSSILDPIAQSELSRSVTGERSIEPSESGTIPSSPDGEDTPADGETDLFGEQVETPEERKAREERELVEFVEASWHEIARANPLIPDIETMAERRRKAVLARAKEHEKPDRTRRQVWERIFERIAESRFLRGLSNPGKDREEPFAVDFEWLLGTKNFGKVLEGNYRDKRGDHSAFEPGTGRKLSAVEQGVGQVSARIRESRQRAESRGNRGGPGPERPALGDGRAARGGGAAAADGRP